MVCIDCRFPKQTDAVTISKKGQNTSQVIPTAFQMAETENRNKIMVYQCEKVHFQSCGQQRSQTSANHRGDLALCHGRVPKREQFKMLGDRFAHPHDLIILLK